MSLYKLGFLCSLAAYTALASSVQGDNSFFKLQQVLANPSAYHAKRVTVAGLADVGGAEFFLYRNANEASKGAETVVAVTWDLDKGPLYEKFNRHWVRVTGIVNAKGHGPLGGCVCEISVERVEPLPRPPIPDPFVYGVFRNDTRYTVSIKLPTPTGYGWSLNICPGGVTSARAIAKGKVTVLDQNYKVVAQGDMNPAHVAKRYFDSSNRTYYYRIANGKVALVKPIDASRW